LLAPGYIAPFFPVPSVLPEFDVGAASGSLFRFRTLGLFQHFSLSGHSRFFFAPLAGLLHLPGRPTLTTIFTLWLYAKSATQLFRLLCLTFPARPSRPPLLRKCCPIIKGRRINFYRSRGSNKQFREHHPQLAKRKCDPAPFVLRRTARTPLSPWGCTPPFALLEWVHRRIRRVQPAR